MKMFIIALISLVCLTGLAYAYQADKLFSLKGISPEFGPEACAKAGGMGALVAPLDENGDLASPFVPHCLVPAK